MSWRRQTSVGRRCPAENPKDAIGNQSLDVGCLDSVREAAVALSIGDHRRVLEQALPLMDDAYRAIAPLESEPQLRPRPPLWANSIWVFAPLALAVVADLVSTPPWAVWSAKIALALVLVAASLRWLHWHLANHENRHLVELQRSSRLLGRGTMSHAPYPEPDFRALDAHFPLATQSHHLEWKFRLSNPDQGAEGPTEDVRQVWLSARPELDRIRAAEHVPNSCYRCWKWIWLARLLRHMPPQL